MTKLTFRESLLTRRAANVGGRSEGQRGAGPDRSTARHAGAFDVETASGPAAFDQAQDDMLVVGAAPLGVAPITVQNKKKKYNLE
jgi:hypothetical protein